MKRTSLLPKLIFLFVLASPIGSGYGQTAGFGDDFNDNSRNTTRWSIGTLHDSNFSPWVDVVEQNQQLRITTPTGFVGYAGYVTASTWNFTDARSSVEVVQTVSAGNDTVFALGLDSGNRYRFVVEDGVLYFQYKVGGGASSSTSVPYSASQHRFWSFKHLPATDQIVFETSTDGTSWVPQRTVARQFANTAVKIELDSGSFTTVGSTTTAVFDNFNLASNGASSSDDPELPRLSVDTTYPTNTALPIQVPAGGNLQSAIDSASPGDTIMLQPGATYLAPEGGFKLRSKSPGGTAWIIIRSASTAFNNGGAIPPGTRVDGANAAHTSQMPRILTQVTNSPAIAAEAGAHHYRLVGLEIGATSGVTSSDASVQLGARDETSTAAMPSFIIVDRCYVHGNDMSVSPYRRGISLQGKHMAVVESHVSDYHDSADAQAIWGSNGPGPFKISNNFLEASGENVMFGGEDPAITDMVPADIEIRRNLLTKRTAWRNASGITVKNLFELKNARRVIFDGNVLEKSWSNQLGGGQSQEYAVNIKSVNQNGNCTWCVSEHVTISNNKIRDVASGIDIGSKDGLPSQPVVNHVKIHNNLIYDLKPMWGPPYGRIFQIRGGASHVKIVHVTAEGSFKTVGVEENNEHNPYLTFKDNIVERGSYGIKGDSEGTTALTDNFGPLTATSYQRNLLVNTSDEPTNQVPQETTVSDQFLLSLYPNQAPAPNTASSGDTFVASTWGQVGFVDRGLKNYRLATGSPYKGKASDGKDLGADQDAIEAAIGGAAGGSSGVLLSDDFNDNARDAKWSIGTLHDTRFHAQVQVTEQNQQLRITTPAGLVGYSGYVTASAWDFTNGRASVEVVQAAGAANDTVFALGLDSGNRYRFVVEEGVLYFQYKVGGGASSSTSVPYSASQHRFWRFKHIPATDQIAFETSADGLSWDTRRTVARQFANTAVKIELDSGAFTTVGSTTTAVFDNFKLER